MPLPAAVDRKHAATTIVDPDACAVETPVFPLATARAGKLAFQGRVTFASQVDRAELVAPFLAFAGDGESVIPVGGRLPRIAAIHPFVAMLIVALCAAVVAIPITFVSVVVGRRDK